jgi:hypothetical protein
MDAPRRLGTQLERRFMPNDFVPEVQRRKNNGCEGDPLMSIYTRIGRVAFGRAQTRRNGRNALFPSG